MAFRIKSEALHSVAATLACLVAVALVFSTVAVVAARLSILIGELQRVKELNSELAQDERGTLIFEQGLRVIVQRLLNRALPAKLKTIAQQVLRQRLKAHLIEDEAKINQELLKLQQLLCSQSQRMR